MFHLHHHHCVSAYSWCWTIPSRQVNVPLRLEIKNNLVSYHTEYTDIKLPNVLITMSIIWITFALAGYPQTLYSVRRNIQIFLIQMTLETPNAL